MDAVLPADMSGDEPPSGFAIVGHVGKSTISLYFNKISLTIV